MTVKVKMIILRHNYYVVIIIILKVKLMTLKVTLLS